MMSFHLQLKAMLCEELLMKRLASEPFTTLQTEAFSVETRCGCGGAISHEETTVLQWSREKKASMPA